MGIVIEQVVDASWDQYIEDTRGADNISPVLNKLFETEMEPEKALDLGAGTGKDTLALLERGWHVTAIDISQTAITTLEERVSKYTGQVEFICGDLKNIPLQKETYKLINATAALPYFGNGNRDEFDHVFKMIVDSLEKGGVMSLQFFGDKHSWADSNSGHPAIFLSSEEVSSLFPPDLFEVEIQENYKPDYYGIPKWHDFFVLVKKKS